MSITAQSAKATPPQPSGALSAPASVAAANAAQPYRSPLVRMLRMCRIGIAAATALWLVVAIVAVAGVDAMTQTIGFDTEASIVAAERIRAGLAAAHADFGAAILTRAGGGEVFITRMRTRIDEVETALADAAGNITYGDAERVPIDTMLRGVARYEQLVGQARAGQGEDVHRRVEDADALMHGTILPAAEQLDTVNFDHLTASYADHAGAVATLIGQIATALLALVAFVVTQVMITRYTHRLLNPALVAATVLVLIGGGLAIHATTAANAALRGAKEDAFDSIHALWKARAVATNARAAITLSLVEAGDAAKAAQARAAYGVLAAATVGKPVADAIRDSDNGRRFPGYIGDELANITFAGELDAAKAMLHSWAAVAATEDRVQDAVARGSTSTALALQTGSAPDGAEAAFAAFDAALGRVLDINTSAFKEAIENARAPTHSLVGVLVVLASAAAAFGFYGIAQRLNEYRL